MSFRLSPREHQVLQGLANGFSYSQIGLKSGIKYSTVKFYVLNAKKRLNANTSIHAVVIGLTLGLIEAPIPGKGKNEILADSGTAPAK
jgi:DNA-binding NarL/FixJ family response regulator